jgi:hypothetical protein
MWDLGCKDLSGYATYRAQYSQRARWVCGRLQYNLVKLCLMEATKERLAFSIGIGAVLVGIALVFQGVADVQTGPAWEIPAKAAGRFILLGLASFVLDGVGIISYFRGNRFRSIGPANQTNFWILLCLGLLTTVLVYFVLDPGQWLVTHGYLSAAMRGSSILVWAICGTLWALLTIRLWRVRSVDV